MSVLDCREFRRLLEAALIGCCVAAAQGGGAPATEPQRLAESERKAEAVLRGAFEAYWEAQGERPGAAASAEEREEAFREYLAAFKKRLAESDKQTEVSLREVFESEWGSELKRTGATATPEQKEQAFRKYLISKRKRSQMARQYVEQHEARHKELVLAGKVVDQDGQPVAEAKVHAKVPGTRSVGLVFHQTITYDRKVTATTDAEGRFRLDGGKGAYMDLGSIEAAGCLFDRKHQPAWKFVVVDPTWKLSSYKQNLAVKGDVTFKLWRMVGEPQKLVVVEA